MASTVAGVIGWGVSDGETIDSPSTRWSTVSRVDVQGGATPLAVRGGILPANGNPLAVSALGTPAMKVTVNAGTCVVPGNTSSIPPFGLTLTANTDLDIATSDPTLGRIDLVVAHIYSDGTSAAYGEFKVVTGTPNASPARPTIPNTGSDHSIVLATVTVSAAVTSIVAAKVAVNSTYDAGFTAAPGGTVNVRAYNDRLSGGVDVPDGQPFFSQYDTLPGFMVGGAPYVWTPMIRFYNAVVTTNVSGDVSCFFGLWLGGGFQVAAFPNALDAVGAVDAIAVTTWNHAVVVKWLTSSSNASTAAFRFYDASTDAPLASKTMRISFVAVGH